VLISRAVEAVEENHVRLSDGTALHAATIVWAAGTEANPVTAGLDVEQDSAGRLIVAKDCSLREHPNVFAIGDIARCRDRHGVLVPPLAAAAIQMGRHVAKIIREDLPLRGSPLQRHAPLLRRPFAYVDKGIMAIIGKSAAVVKIKQWSMKGFIAWLAWLFVHLLLLVGFRNKLSVLLQWAFAYLKEKRSARIIVAP
jgi:NADH dehydrogenase